MLKGKLATYKFSPEVTVGDEPLNNNDNPTNNNNTTLLNTTTSTSTMNGVILDGYLLLEASGEKDPEFSSSAKLIRKNLVHVEIQDLALFVSLTHLDVTDNHLTLSDFVLLPSIQQLSLCCNGINKLTSIPNNAFSNLQKLDLSHNLIPASTLQFLLHIPLTTLNLTSNDLKILPSSLQLPTTLHTLILDHNFLTPQSLIPLCSLPQLKILELNYNKFKGWKISVESESDDFNNSFSSLEELGLCSNSLSSWENLQPLLALPKLSKVYLWENPILSTIPFDTERIQFYLTANANNPFSNTIVDVVNTDDEYAWKKTRKIDEIPSRIKIRSSNEGVPILTKKKAPKKESAFPPLANIASFSHSVSNSIVNSPHSITRENINMTFLTQESEVDLISELNNRELSFIPFIDELNLMKSGFDTVGPLVDGIDSRAAINALQYALLHPLTTHYPDISKEKGITRSTENHSIRVKERGKVRIEKDSTQKSSMTFTQRHAAQRENRAILSAQQKMSNLKQKLHLAETNLNSAITSFNNLENAI